jgi:hypothetical protein
VDLAAADLEVESVERADPADMSPAPVLLHPTPPMSSRLCSESQELIRSAVAECRFQSSICSLLECVTTAGLDNDQTFSPPVSSNSGIMAIGTRITVTPGMSPSREPLSNDISKMTPNGASAELGMDHPSRANARMSSSGRARPTCMPR